MQNKQLLESVAINKYKQTIIRMLKLSYPNLSYYDLETVVNMSIMNNFKNTPAVIDNNYKKRTVNTTLLDLTDYIMKREPIITAYGTMFKKHAEVPNPIAKLLETFMEGRNIYKKEMFKYPKGSEEFEKYNLLQLLAKIDANGFYGALGMYSCLYYNLYVSASVTSQGRSLISSASLQFEMFLNDNVKWGSLNEIVTFIDNIVTEKRIYDDSQILDRDITRAECFYKVMKNCGFNYIPTDEDLEIVWNIMCNLKQQDINRIYYKNNLFGFMENKSMTNAIIYMLKKLKKPYLDPNKLDKDIAVELEEFTAIIKEYVYYSYQIIDKIDRYSNMIRSVTCITDTDSSMVSLDGWYRFILDKVDGIDMEIKRTLIDPISYLEQDEFGETEKLKVIEYVDDLTDFDFKNDELIQIEKSINIMNIIPQEGLRYSIINILAYILGDVINDYMLKYTKASNSYSEDKKCLIIMKNEFLFKSIMITEAKKNYASIQEIQEGNIVNKENMADLDIKGLPLTKAGTNKRTQDKLKQIIYENILGSDTVDQVKVLKELAIFEKEIFESLSTGQKTFYKPVRIKSYNNYDDPMRQQGIKAAIVWNAVRDESKEAIDLEIRNSIDILKINITPRNVEKIEDEDLKNKLIDLMKQKEFNTGISTIGIPKNSTIPDWIIDFIDYKTIINDNIKLFPLDPIGIYKINNNNNYTNMIKI